MVFVIVFVVAFVLVVVIVAVIVFVIFVVSSFVLCSYLLSNGIGHYHLLFITISCSVLLAMTLDEDVFGGVPSSTPTMGKSESGKKRERDNEALPIYEVPAVKLLRAGNKSAIEELGPNQRLWDWMEEKHPCGYAHRAEVAHTNIKLRGVGISRFAQSMTNWIRSFKEQRAFQALLKPEHFDAILKEANSLLPHFEVLDGSGLPAIKESELRSKKTLYDARSYHWKDPAKVKESAAAILKWMENGEQSKLRIAIKMFASAGLSWCAYADHTVIQAYLNHGDGKKDFSAACEARLCQGSCSPVREKLPEDLSKAFE